MLACVCQPTDAARLFSRRSPNLLEMAPKPRALLPPRSKENKSPIKVITREPTKQLKNFNENSQPYKKNNLLLVKNSSSDKNEKTKSVSTSRVVIERSISIASKITTDEDVKPKLKVKDCERIFVKAINETQSSNQKCSTKYSKENFDGKLPDGVQLTLLELREMACRQQHQIESQHQLLAAKEQRLRYLKEQEANHQLIAAENERLRRLRERVDAQELKLRKLRALRGQVDQNKQSNVSLTSDLDSIRALFNEKEKELSMAVAKVDELTRQLEEIRRGSGIPNRDQPPSAAALELDKLRRELMYRNKLNEQQKVRLCQQREALTARQEEMNSIDKRISELQDRLHRKRVLNQQLANQISAASHKAAQNMQQPLRCSAMGVQVQHNGLPKQPSRGNIAAVEPFKHIPNNGPVDPIIQKPDPSILSTTNKIPSNYQTTVVHQVDHEKQQQLEFTPSKSDPKYQTLPYNTKFTINAGKSAKSEHVDGQNWNQDNETANLKSMTVHSTPLSIINKSLATPLNQISQQNNNNNNISNNNIHNNKIVALNVNGDLRIRGQPVGAPITSTVVSSTSSAITTSISTANNKPVSSVAPTNKLSTIYQTSSTKILPVQPQSPQLALSPPQSQSTPITSPEVDNKPKPALPPKPAIKPPPRQTQPNCDEKETAIIIIPPPPLPPQEEKNPIEISSSSCSSSSGSSSSNNTNSVAIIKARPLQIKKQPLSEQPRLRSLGSKINGYHVSINRRIEMPPAFFFPEMDTPPADLLGNEVTNLQEQLDKPKEEVPLPAEESNLPNSHIKEEDKPSSTTLTTTTTSTNNNNNVISNSDASDTVDSVVLRVKKGNLKQTGKSNLSRRVSFDPLALLLDASLEGELELVKKTATQVPNPSAANDEGITALHNAICAGHLEIVKFLVEFGCDVNAQDSDGWTPLHCAASCNNVAMVRFLVEHGACIFATTLSDHETAAEKCEEDEEGFDGCSEYLYSVQEKLGILSGGAVYAVFDYTAQQPDELSFTAGQQLTVLRKGDENEREWWWTRLNDNEGYIPRNLLGLYPRVTSKSSE